MRIIFRLRRQLPRFENSRNVKMTKIVFRFLQSKWLGLRQSNDSGLCAIRRRRSFLNRPLRFLHQIASVDQNPALSFVSIVEV